MYRILGILFLLCTAGFANAQVIPSEGSALSYRLIGFSLPKMQKAANTLQIALGNYNNEDSFKKHIISSSVTKQSRVIATVPYFGSRYTWRTVTRDSKSTTTTSSLHHFSTMTVPEVNPDSMRLRIIDSAVQHKDDYVFLDGNKVLYDMKGNPVWYFPNIEDLPRATTRPRDLKITPFGSISFLADDLIYEISYTGDILWKGPVHHNIRKDSAHLSNLHHHEFTRLSSGHYMALAFERSLWDLGTSLDSTVFSALHGKIKRENGEYYQKIMFGAVVEFDAQGNLLWKWNSGDYFKNSDLYSHRMAYNLFDLDNTHENAFYFDERNQVIYVSFRDINRIVKIQYPSGKVLNTYGALYTPGGPAYLVNGLFCGQHNCRLSQDGYLYMFNNNLCNPKSNPTILMLREPVTEKDSLQKVWEYVCPMDEVHENKQAGILFNSGGSVAELADSSFFVCMGSAYGKVFIVNRDKALLWCAQPEKWDITNGKWANQI